MKTNNNEHDKPADIKDYLGNLEMDFVEGDVLSEIRDFFKDKFVEKHAKFDLVKTAKNLEEDISNEEQEAFVLEHGIEVKQNIEDLNSEYLMLNFKQIKFCGINYYLRLKHYGDNQNVFDYLVENYIVSAAA